MGRALNYLRKRRQHRRGNRANSLVAQLAVIGITIMVIGPAVTWMGYERARPLKEAFTPHFTDGRRLASDDKCDVEKINVTNNATALGWELVDKTPAPTPEGASEFPTDPIPMEYKEKGAILIHVIIMLYMFAGLAIVCDEYFESSLEAICRVLKLKEDVAGATFMAAGGSAPELFTSIMGVFVAKNDIGIGTIVGSAVFNVLFVIGLCAFFAPGLPLTYWPLVRDSVFYSVGIMVLVACIIDQEVHVWEAAILLVFYGIYIAIMASNQVLNNIADKCLTKNTNRKKPRWQEILIAIVFSKWVEAIIYLIIVANVVSILVAPLNQWVLIANYIFSAIFVAELIIKMIALDPFGYWRDPLNAFDGTLVLLIFFELALSGSAYAGGVRALRFFRFFRILRGLRLIRLYRAMRMFHAQTKVAETQTDFDNDTKELVHYAGNIWKTAEGSLVEHMNVSKKIDVGSKKKTAIVPASEDAVADSLKSAEEGDAASTADDVEDAGESTPSGGDDNGEEAKAGEEGGEDGDDDDDDDDDDDPANPFIPPGDCKSIMGILSNIYWAFSFPLQLAMFLTIPDCRRKLFRHFWWAQFILCIVWIAALSYVMVWMATLLGELTKIPDPVMGLTLLAAGTSIPDALSSIAVARKGYGDMAVSSSIGSNVFDILIGLPVPWFIYTSVVCPLCYVPVYSDGLTIMILTLFIMVALTIAIIVLSGWKLSMNLAFCMIVLYFAFVIQSLLLEYDIILPEC